MELTIVQLNKFYQDYQDYQEYSRDDEIMSFGEYVENELKDEDYER